MDSAMLTVPTVDNSTDNTIVDQIVGQTISAESTPFPTPATLTDKATLEEEDGTAPQPDKADPEQRKKERQLRKLMLQTRVNDAIGAIQAKMAADKNLTATDTNVVDVFANLMQVKTKTTAHNLILRMLERDQALTVDQYKVLEKTGALVALTEEEKADDSLFKQQAELLVSFLFWVRRNFEGEAFNGFADKEASGKITKIEEILRRIIPTYKEGQVWQMVTLPTEGVTALSKKEFMEIKALIQGFFMRAGFTQCTAKLTPNAKKPTNEKKESNPTPTAPKWVLGKERSKELLDSGYVDTVTLKCITQTLQTFWGKISAMEEKSGSASGITAEVEPTAENTEATEGAASGIIAEVEPTVLQEEEKAGGKRRATHKGRSSKKAKGEAK